MKVFDYFYGLEAEQFTFFRIPKLLITESEFSRLSDSAKIMYGLFLDRTSLSRKNGWLDDQNRAYVIFSVEEIMEALNCGNQKVAKVLAELDTKKGIGLIERVRRGFGKPDIIYVKNFSSNSKNPNSSSSDENNSGDNQSTSLEKADNSEFSQKCENHISRSVNNTSLEMCKSHLQKCENHISSDVITTSLIINNTENNKTDSNNTDERVKLRRRSRKYEAENMHEKKKDEVDDNPKMTSQVQERIRWLSQDDDVIPLTPREKKMFDLFILERKRRGKETSRVQRNTMIQNLHLYGHDEYVRLEILEKTIAKGWNDIYPLDRGAPGATNQEEGNSYGNGSI